MRPETTVVILDEAEGETTVNITNTDVGPALLYSTIENIPEDTELLAVLSPPITRVEGGETQLVRVLFSGLEPLKTQRLKRVTFEGIPHRSSDTGATIGVTLRQNLPLIVHPKGLPRNPAPWELLKWQRQGSDLIVRNDSPYVVRLSPEVLLKPQEKWVTLARSYVLPGEVLTVRLDDVALAGLVSVSFQPATVYGFAVDSYDAPIDVL